MIAEPRLFLAVPLDEAARAAVEDVVVSVRARAIDGRGVRWVRLDGLHVTLRFLGPTPESRIPDLADAMAEAASGFSPVHLELVGAGGFPARGRPRTIWVGIEAGRQELATLNDRLNDSLFGRGWPRDERPFRAHLTLARADGARSGPAVVEALAETVRDRTIGSVVDRLVLFESVTGRGPARYVARAEVALR